ncbi:MAG: amidohydrolase [Selenomonas sp.]|nr:amidohydrolase [Selenomonas sp.]
MLHCDSDFARASRRYFHQHPELSLQEYETAKYIREKLTEFGIEYRTVGETGTYGWIRGRSDNGRKILLRADIDALPLEEQTDLPYKSVNPGVMHACGHDIHAAALLAAAKKLAEVREEFSGTVLLAFQQAEEKGHGARYFQELGLTRGYDRAFGVHIAPDVHVGTVVLSRKEDAASCDFFRLTIKGRKSHTSKPHLGRDALQAGAVLVGEIAKLPGRLLPPAEPINIGIGTFKAGTSYNIVADSAVIEGSIRTFSEDNRSRLKEKIGELADSMELIYGVQVLCEYECFARALINDETARQEVARVAASLLGEDKVQLSEQPVFGFAGDDFSEFLQESQGAYAHVGVWQEDSDSAKVLHSEKLAPAEEAVDIAADLHINYALAFLRDSGHWGEQKIIK